LFGSLPTPLRHVIAAFVRRRVRNDLLAQGLGRHSQDELYALGRSDLEAIATLLGDRPFFAADRPTTIDTVAYGHLANTLLVPIETELKRIAEGFPNLVAWTEAMDRRFA
jgi:glutathione S-transferase